MSSTSSSTLSSSENESNTSRFTRDVPDVPLSSTINAETTTSNSIERKRPEHSNTLHQFRKQRKSHHHYQKIAQNAYRRRAGDTTNKYALPILSRVPRAAQKPESIENLRKKLKGDKLGKHPLQKLDLKQKLAQLNRTLARHQEPIVVGGINREERPHPKKKDNLSKLYEFSNMERREPYVHPGAECNFEKDCRWTWKTDIQNGFVIASVHNLMVNESGPFTDADDNNNGN
ncbi:hypothetical protein Trydic_g14871 [Trypoxylus dichotomus]